MKQWITPTMQYYSLYADMLQQTHLLIAGATGSGKSVVINGIITTSLKDSPAQVQYILIDPKRVELAQYRPLPHTIAYASEPDSMIQALRTALDIIESRYKAMQRQGVRKYTGSHIYVVIDELADLMTTNKKQVQPLIQRIAQIGRAANVHIIAATQCPLSAVIPTPIKVNFDSRVGLRTRSRQDSRNILGCGGCELLPSYGQGYYMTAQGIDLYRIPMYDQTTISALIHHWTRQKRPLSLFHRH
jgi:S-DNA-T family DNA segregation ATPase FtsK/SpoIIIE